jgi:hypothetical protein
MAPGQFVYAGSSGIVMTSSKRSHQSIMSGLNRFSRVK